MTGREMRMRRRAGRMTQKRFAALIGYSQPLVSRCETGDMPISDDVAQAVEDAFSTYNQGDEQ